MIKTENRKKKGRKEGRKKGKKKGKEGGKGRDVEEERKKIVHILL